MNTVRSRTRAQRALHITVDFRVYCTCTLLRPPPAHARAPYILDFRVYIRFKVVPLVILSAQHIVQKSSVLDRTRLSRAARLTKN